MIIYEILNLFDDINTIELKQIYIYKCEDQKYAKNLF